MGWMYRTTDLVAAFTRSQLRRLDEMNQCRIDNARLLTDALSQYNFVSFPNYKDDRTCVYWFYPIKLSAKAAGFDVSDVKFRDWISEALTAEGLRIGPWQLVTLPEQSIFHDKVGYGKGSPWSDPSYKGDVAYIPENYPNAKMVEETTWFSNMYFWPQTSEDIKYAIAAFEKVFTRLYEVIDYFSKKKD